MMLLALALLQAAATPSDAATEARYERCIDLATTNPVAARSEAGKWQLANGGWFAHQCLGMAYATEGGWSAAAVEFEAAARAAEVAKDKRAAQYWAQAGNAWLAGGANDKASAALNSALSAGTLTGLQLGEAHLDRARVLYATGDLDGARRDLDAALAVVPEDPLAWLLSATLARRAGDLPRARKDIAEAESRTKEAPEVQLEKGNIAAASGDEAGARAAWGIAAVGKGAAAESATRALAQFYAK
ncbi:tetratricopeptide repeat protein [Sphingomonas aracearum]|uniref:Tetratricopeptide repeat protein n=1 Tax=Sphingomonas aracearum TaxID=2283317 RepID=A0A369W1A8_9SPHN|nr:tetratricopeptide repeat protein [Sphingomonas aracearum]RDE07052.1 tetratricopeptide repeat protein [Sphingomonas aracearum]